MRWLYSPGGRLRVGEHETDGLRRKLTNKLGTPNPESTVNWQIGELVSTWWRPNFETVMYPYVPPQVASPKECRKIFLTQLPPTGILGVPKNLKLLAVPLFELYDNAHRYGPVIASLPQLLARVKFVFCDHNAQPLSNPHIAAYQLTNIEIYSNKLKKMKEENGNESSSKDKDNKNGMDVDNHHPSNNANVVGMNANNAVLNGNNNNANGNKLSINPLMNYRAGLMGNIYAQRLLMAQQLMAQNMLRMPATTIRPPNARVILQPSPQSNPIASNPLLMQQLIAAQQQKPPLLPRPHGLVSPPAANVSLNTNQSQNMQQQQPPQRPTS